MKTINQLDLRGKRVLIRVDFNVPMKDGIITSDKRIIEALPTINYAINQGAKVILLSHLGRVKTQDDKIKKSLLPVAQRLCNYLNKPINFCNVSSGDIVVQSVNMLEPGGVLVLENTRFEDLNDKAESKNAEWLAKFWSSLAEVYINDAFGTSHRSHASNVGITNNIQESAIGFLVEKELKALSKVIEKPQRPSVAIIGGAKVSDKIKVIDRLASIYDKVLIGGGMSYTFKKAMGQNIGDSIVENDQLETAKELLKKYSKKIILPVDTNAATEYKDVPPHTFVGDIPNGYTGLDIGPKTIEIFKDAIKGAKTVVWNGPLGVCEFSNYQKGTYEIAKAITQLKDAYTVIGGGDSAAAIINLGLEKSFSHISTGGGASLCLLQGDKLPGIESIELKTKN